MSGCIRHQASGKSSLAGFTLVELLVTLVVLAIVVALAAPRMGAFRRRNQGVTLINSYVFALHQARSEAITRGLAVSVCQSRDGRSCSGDNTWHTGWLVFLDPSAKGECSDANADGYCDKKHALIVLQHTVAANGFRFSANGHPASGRVTYNAAGYATGQQSTFVLCDLRGLIEPMGLVLNTVGRTRIADADTLRCPLTANQTG